MRELVLILTADFTIHYGRHGTVAAKLGHHPHTPVVVAAEDDTDDVLADVVHVAFDRRQDNGADKRRRQILDTRLQSSCLSTHRRDVIRDVHVHNFNVKSNGILAIYFN